MTALTTAIEAPPAHLHPAIAFPEDRGLGDLPDLFSPEWVASAYHALRGQDGPPPDRYRIRQIGYTPGREATVSYLAEWDPERYLPSVHFTAALHRDGPVEVSLFPDDKALPGLPPAVDPDAALRLVNAHVLAIGAKSMRVEVVRYRPGTRAVLRHQAGRVGLYARVMPPAALPPFLKSWETIARSSFVAPRIAGHWDAGGVVWMTEIPGKNLRGLLRRGKRPDPAVLLRGLETLWAQPAAAQPSRPFSLQSAYRSAKRRLTHFARESATASAGMAAIAKPLDAFVESWRPTAIAHNDFYDDQCLVLPDGRVALVDLEEAGPGDPMLDVGNFMAHLRWRARLGRGTAADVGGVYREAFRALALGRFRWASHDLDLREAVCLFRLCTNVVRYPRDNWRDRLEAGLDLVRATLD